MTNNRNRRLDPAEVQAKQDRVFKRLKVTNDGSVEENPYLREYHETLTRLGEAKASSQDSFINWLTGLNAAAMSLALTGIEAAPHSIRVLQMFAALAFLLGVIAAIAFKAFLSVRYAHIEAEAEIRATQFYALTPRLASNTSSLTGVLSPKRRSKHSFDLEIDSST